MNSFPPVEKTLTVYTALRIINQIKKECGVEAALEYCEYFCRVCERDNPRLKIAVDAALRITNASKLYKETVENWKDEEQ